MCQCSSLHSDSSFARSVNLTVDGETLSNAATACGFNDQLQLHPFIKEVRAIALRRLSSDKNVRICCAQQNSALTGLNQNLSTWINWIYVFSWSWEVFYHFFVHQESLLWNILALSRLFEFYFWLMSKYFNRFYSTATLLGVEPKWVKFTEIGNYCFLKISLRWAGKPVALSSMALFAWLLVMGNFMTLKSQSFILIWTVGERFS